MKDAAPQPSTHQPAILYFERLSLARIEDIHSALVENMGVEPSLRYRRVRITGTRYQPLDVESQIREAVDDMCALINGKEDPYEKALLALLLPNSA